MTETIDTLMTIKQVAETLAVSERTVWRLIATETLPSIKIGTRRTRVRASDVQAFINPPAAPVNPDAVRVPVPKTLTSGKTDWAVYVPAPTRRKKSAATRK